MVSRIMKNIDIIIVSLIVTILSTFGKIASDLGMNWYQSLNLPPLTPPSWVFGLTWTLLYIFAACAVIILMRSYKHIGYYRSILGLFALCAILNIVWSYVFFIHNSIAGALIDCIVIEFNLITIIAATWHDARTLALLMLPGAVWVVFALYINYQILFLN
jgi:tryptophan-rich sensory protein